MIKTFRRKLQTFIEGHEINKGIFMFMNEKTECYKYQERLLTVFLSWQKQLCDMALVGSLIPSLLNQWKWGDLTDKSGKIKLGMFGSYLSFLLRRSLLLGECLLLSSHVERPQPSISCYRVIMITSSVSRPICLSH